jgi:hypothetical protein
MKPRHPASRECRKRKCQKRCCRPEDGRDRRSKRVTTAHVLQGGGALGYMVRAFLVVNCQSTLMWLALRSCSQAAISSMRVCLSRMRRSRHWDVRMPSSYSARSSQPRKWSKPLWQRVRGSRGTVRCLRNRNYSLGRTGDECGLGTAYFR